MMKSFKKVAIAAALVAAMSTTAQATPITGIANLTFGAVVVSLGEIDWNPPINAGLDLTPTYGSFVVNTAISTGSFAPLPPAFPTMGWVQDMSNNLLDANYVPIGAGNTPSFLQFIARPNWQFTMTNLAPGMTFGMYTSPYILTESGGNVSATISMSGSACDTGMDLVCNIGDDINPWTGIFSAQYTNTSIAGIVATLSGGGSLNNNTWSATIAVPEPGSLALLGLGLLGLGALRLRREV